MKESTAERLRFRARLPIQTEPLEEGEQVLGGEHQLQQDLVGSELAQGKLRSPVSFAVADAILDGCVARVPGLELGQVGLLLVGYEDRKRNPTRSVKVSWAPE